LVCLALFHGWCVFNLPSYGRSEHREHEQSLETIHRALRAWTYAKRLKNRILHGHWAESSATME
jgi:hypothetical protein